jgi:tRNA(Ile2)-agmatinylcytidine synthase
MYTLHVGIDDTDSKDGMCTTYLCSVIVDKLKACGYHVDNIPRLIRLNPFAPHKTRGNGAVSFKLILKTKDEEALAKNIILELVEELAEMHDSQTNPGVVFYRGQIKPLLRKYALETIRNIVTFEYAESLANEINAEIIKYKNGRGIIGALAAIGCPLDDKTYELIAYRQPSFCGKKRMVDQNSVIEMNFETYPATFDNLDKGYITITPHTPCPVLYGIRGESLEVLLNAQRLVKSYEPIKSTMVFVTNQHTDLHIQNARNIAEIKKFQCYSVDGTVKNYPKTIEGGHVIFNLYDESEEVECAAYEPTKDFRDIIRHLRPGDHLMVYGGMGSKGTLNLEKMKIIQLAKTYESQNPLCKCGKRMKSAGKNKGFKCPSCGSKFREAAKEIVEIERQVHEGFYEVPPSARRHLSKPLIRN